jgi:hypothetical protein
MLRPYRLAAVILLPLVLASGSLRPVAARPLRESPKAEAPAAGIPAFALNLWRQVVRLLEKSGSGIDPFGQPSSAQSRGDSGSGIDPFGGK